MSARMKAAPELAPAAVEDGSHCSPATVIAAGAGRTCRVTRAGAIFEAQLATPGYEDPREGDVVLVLSDDRGAHYVIGVVRAPRSKLDEVLAEPPSDRVYDKRGRLLFEYDRDADRAVLHVPEGDLVFAVPQGQLTLEAQRGVHIESEGAIGIASERAVVLDAQRGEERSSVHLEPGKLSLTARVISAAAARVDLVAHRVGISSHQVETHVDRVLRVVDVLETRAGRIVEHARDSYRESEGLSQTKAGRLRLVAQKAIQVVGENALIKARDRMKIKGEQIHLA
jgi:hypothetical protein